MYNNIEISSRIKLQAKDSQVSLKTMLTDLGLGINLISQLAKGQNITAINLAQIADYLGCSVDYLLGRTEQPEINKPKGDKFMEIDFSDKQLVSLYGLFRRKLATLEELKSCENFSKDNPDADYEIELYAGFLKALTDSAPWLHGMDKFEVK